MYFILHVYSLDGYSVTRAKDGTQISIKEAKQMVKIFRDRPKYKNIFSAFHYMDVREDYVRFYRNPSKLYPEWNQNNSHDLRKGDGLTFKYNTFPSQNDVKTSKDDKITEKNTSEEIKIKLDSSENFTNLLKEFETRLNFYENHRIDWVSKIKKVSTLLLQNLPNNGDQAEAAANMRIEYDYLNNQEKEVIEGVDELEAKHHSLDKLIEELSMSASTSDYQIEQVRYNKLVIRLVEFKKEFLLEKQALSSLNLKINDSN